MQWFENEAFWQAFYPAMFDAKRFERAPEEVALVLKLAGLEGRTNLAILDLCCGPGRHSEVLSRSGRVTAVDRTPFLLAKARERLKSCNAEVVASDMREFKRPGAFDLAVNLFTSFGYFETRDEDVRVLQNLLASLKPGGVLVMELVSKEWLAANLKETSSEDLPDGSLLVERHRITDGWGRIENEWLLLKAGRYTSHRFSHNIYSGVELADALHAAGFKSVRIVGNLEGVPYDGKSGRRLVAVATK